MADQSITHVLEQGTIKRIEDEIIQSECVVLLMTTPYQFRHDPIIIKQMELGIQHQKPIIVMIGGRTGWNIPTRLKDYSRYHGYVIHNSTKQDVAKKFYNVMVAWNSGKRRFP